MNEVNRLKYLKITLVSVGIIFIAGIYSLSIVWPSGWKWHTGNYSDYLTMIEGIYATLGVFLILAARNPLAHLNAQATPWPGTLQSQYGLRRLARTNL